MTEAGDEAVIDEILNELRALREENSALRSQTAGLQARVEALATQAGAGAGAGAAQPLAEPPDLSRRRLLTMAGAAGVGVVGAYAGLVVAKPKVADAFFAAGLPLVQYMSFGDSFTLTPVDASVRWDRTAPVGVPPGYTHMVHALFSTSDQQSSFAWPLFVELRGTDHPAATTATSQSTGVQVRAFNRGTGAPWVVGFHSEVHHGAGYDGTTGADQAPAVANQGTTIGYNLELVRKSPLGRAVGLNLHNNPVSQLNGTEALLIKGSGPNRGWEKGIRFEATSSPGAEAISVEEDYATALAVRSPGGTTGVLLDNGRTSAPAGTRGLWIRGRYATGIDLGANSIVMDAGQKVFLDATRQVWLRYNPARAQIEFGNGTSVIGHLSTSGPDHAL